MNSYSLCIRTAFIALILSGRILAEDGWSHAGSLFLLTTPDGADLPAAALEENFPVLIRLHKDFFEFGEAQPKGEDIRFFSRTGEALHYQIEEWDAANGTASIWVRVPRIAGNARQEIRLKWGNAGAQSESSGSAVFNASNGYLSVWHMNDTVQDEVGTLTCVNKGTTPTRGLIGPGRHFDGGQGIHCGESISNYPSGSSPSTTEAWFRAYTTNTDIVAWGIEGGNGGKVRMRLVSPPHIKVDSNFRDVAGASTLPMSEWIHVAHTYSSGHSLIYINGKLDGATTPMLAIKSPIRMWIGGWYNNYSFVGDIDEVRISRVTRSADWIKMEYENQKALQTLAGPVVKAGNAFSVSSEELTVLEGKSATVSAKAEGAQKLYWILKRNGKDTIVAVDRNAYTFEAGRVSADTQYVLELKAVFPDEVKTKDIRVTIREDIPEPVVSLQAPQNWNGRDAIELVPSIANLAALQAKGAAELHYKWTVSGGAVVQEVAAGKLLLKRSQFSGLLTVTAEVDNGGPATIATAAIQIIEPPSDPWVQRTPEKDEKPEENQFYARDDKNEGTLYYNGTLEQNADAVVLKVYADDKIYKTESQKPAADKSYAFTVKLAPGLIKYKVEFGTTTGGTDILLQTVNNLVCGDAYLIEGQSNALATDTGEKSPAETSEWIRSYGGPRPAAKGLRANLWCNPVWKAQKGEKAELGWWAMELAKRLVESRKIPIFIINGAVGGTRIDQHQRNDSNPADLNTIYGRMLWRVQQARMTHGIRCVIWHQGEADQGSDGPTGGYGWETYLQYFVSMSAGWKQDLPNVRHYYIFQIWPNACSQGGGHGDMLRETQRTLPRLYSNMDIMSTLGIKPAGGCHYPLKGWSEFARLLQPLIERDFYGKRPEAPITPPNLQRASYTSPARDTIALEFDHPVLWKESLTGQFYLDGIQGKVASGVVIGNILTLKLTEPSAAQKITYLKEMSWNQEKLLIGVNGIAALTFCEVPIAGGVR